MGGRDRYYLFVPAVCWCLISCLCFGALAVFLFFIFIGAKRGAWPDLKADVVSLSFSPFRETNIPKTPTVISGDWRVLLRLKNGDERRPLTVEDAQLVLLLLHDRGYEAIARMLLKSFRVAAGPEAPLETPAMAFSRGVGDAAACQLVGGADLRGLEVHFNYTVGHWLYGPRWRFNCCNVLGGPRTPIYECLKAK